MPARTEAHARTSNSEPLDARGSATSSPDSTRCLYASISRRRRAISARRALNSSGSPATSSTTAEDGTAGGPGSPLAFRGSARRTGCWRRAAEDGFGAGWRWLRVAPPDDVAFPRNSCRRARSRRRSWIACVSTANGRHADVNGVVVTQPPHTRAPSVEKPWQREGRVPGVAALMVQRHWMDPDAIPETLAEHQLACAGAERQIACRVAGTGNGGGCLPILLHLLCKLGLPLRPPLDRCCLLLHAGPGT